MSLHHYSIQERAGSKGFTLIELMISLAIAAILAMIAIPSYKTFIDRSKMRTAQADLVSLSVVIENAYQRTLAYPTISAGTALPNSALSTSLAFLNAWRPSSPSTDFTFSLVSSPSPIPSGSGTDPIFYKLTATGAGALSGCKITLTDLNVRETDGCPLGNGGWL